MLAALERGVKGGRWFSLIDKVYSLENLRSSWVKVLRNRGSAGVDRQSVQMFERRADELLLQLQRDLKEGRYEPLPALRRWIPKPGTQKMRPLGIPAVRDRIVQGALRNVLEPLWEAKFAEHSYGFRPGRSCHGALERVVDLLGSGSTWVVDADIQSYFDTIHQDRLILEVEKEVADGRVLELLRRFLKQSVVDGVKEWTPEMGTPQGAVISPLLANIYLHPVDLAMREAGFEMVRYADDLVILCRSESEAQEALAHLRALMVERSLTLHPEKTRLVDATVRGGFDFLGYHFERGMKWPRKKSLAAFRDKIRAKTRRTVGRSLIAVIQTLNPMLRGWFEYFKLSFHNVFPTMDGFVRRRLRSILRKQSKRKRSARSRGNDNVKWPKAYFRDRGLLCLQDAYASLCQPR
jgi:RNA-directed DNA polymerase